MTEAPTGRLARWSRRKSAARRGATLPAEPAAAAVSVTSAGASEAIADGQQQTSAPASVAGAAPAADEPMPTLPSIEELTAESDYTVFLAKGVPEALTRAALRKLWRSDPVLANLDGLNDYDEDYHLIDTTITAAQTNYQASKGYIDAAEEKLAKLEDTPSGHAGESSAQNPESYAIPDGGDSIATTQSESNAADNDSSAALPHIAASEAGAATPETEEDTSD